MSEPRKTTIASLVLLAGLFWAGAAEGVQKGPGEDLTVKLAKPTPQQAAWQDMEIGMFICFGIETWQDKETDDEPVMENLKLFNPTNVDTDQWVSVAESIGAQYIILVAKHHGGFCLWQTETTEYSIKNSPYKNGKGDIVAELAESCRKKGMKLGIYISPADFSQKTAGGGRSNDAEVQEKYSKIYRQQWTELLSRYGQMMEVWFDGSTVIKMDDIIEKYAPNTMVFQSPWATIRWVGNEAGYSPYPAWNSVNSDDPVVQAGHSTARHGDPDGDRWLPNECDTVIRDRWFWNSTNAETLKSVDKLMDIYYNSVGHGAVLLLNIAPDTSGRILEADVKRAAEFGAEVKRRFGKSITETKGKGNLVELTLDKPTTIDHVITMENIMQGERVREYVVEGLIDGNWKKIAEGTAIGHKKIDKFEPVLVSKIRLRVNKSAATPIIRKLAVYKVLGRKIEEQLALPTPQQAEWHDLELGTFIHFGLGTWGRDNRGMQNFNPTNLDTDEWVRVAESMGAKYIVYTAKHGDGFCMWQTDTTDFSIKSAPWRDGKGDILAELAESCRKRGMNLGVYIQATDRHHGAAVSGKCSNPQDQEKYNKIYRQQLTEVLSRYRTMFEVWFDGSCVVPVGDILEKYAPNAMVFQGPHATIRWVGNEQGYAPYPGWNSLKKADAESGVATARHGDPDGGAWLPLECDARIRASWMYRADNADTLKSVDELMDMYYRSVGRGAVLLLNNTPDPTGLIPEADAKRSAEFGAEIKRRFGKSIAETKERGEVVELTLKKPATIDHIITMEDIRQGERVREYVIEALTDGNWQKIAEGTAIGHKKIDRFEPVEASSVRLRVTKSTATPIIRKLAVYNTAAEVSAGKTPSPQDYNTVWTWNPESVKTRWAGIELDLSPYIDEPRQYELLFKKTAGENELEVKSIVLVLAGVEIPGFAEPLDSLNSFNINITATPSRKSGSIKLRATVRGKDGTDTHGTVLIRKVPIQ